MRIPCTHCERVFTRRYNYERHIRSVEQVKPFACSFCPRTFSDVSVKDRHIQLHLQQGRIEPWWCTDCMQTFPDTCALQRHEAAVHGKSRAPAESSAGGGESDLIGNAVVSQESCSSERSGASAEGILFELEHESVSNPCEIEDQNQSPRERGTFFETETEKLAESTLPFNAEDGEERGEDLGGEDFSGEWETDSELPLSSLRTIFCTKCPPPGRLFSTRRDLMVHHTTIHAGGRPFRCPLCPDRKKAFLTAASYSIHLADHANHGEKVTENDGLENQLLSCEVCGRFFGTSSLLKRHLVTHRSTLLTASHVTWQCDTCEEKFRQKSSLIRHVFLRHNRRGAPKVVECGKCGKLFTRSDSRKRHESQCQSHNRITASQ